MSPYVEPSFASLHPDFEQLLTAPLDGWAQHDGLGIAFSDNEEVLNAFRVATKYLYFTDFGKVLLKLWHDEMAGIRKTNEDYSLRNFIDDLGYLKNFDGLRTGQLLKYYLSPDAIEDAEWTHNHTWTSTDGKYVAYVFSSFRPEDTFLWVQEVATGRGAVYLSG